MNLIYCVNANEEAIQKVGNMYVFMPTSDKSISTKMVFESEIMNRSENDQGQTLLYFPKESLKSIKFGNVVLALFKTS